MIVTDDDALAERLRRLRHQGMSISDHARHGLRPTLFEQYPEVGFNYRITDVQAAIAIPQLSRLQEILDCRRRIANRYSQALANHPLLAPPHVPYGLEPNWQTYQVSLHPSVGQRRNDLMDQLYDLGVPTRRGVMASHLEPPYRGQSESLPVTEAVAASTFQLPIHSDLTRDQQNQIIAALQSLRQ
jgi:perosamine synthetase